MTNWKLIELKDSIMTLVKSSDYNTGYDDICIAQENLVEFENRLMKVIYGYFKTTELKR